MPESITSTLAIARQAFEELTQLVSLEELARSEFGSEPKRTRVERLLKILHKAVNITQAVLASSMSHDPPVVGLPASHARFYREILRPHGKALQRAYFEISGMGIMARFLEDSPDAEPQQKVRDAIRAALGRWTMSLEDEELADWYEKGLDLEGAEEFIELPLFQPDELRQNLRLLEPVSVAGSPEVLRAHERTRLTEIYRAFAYGLWMAAIALSRSLVEFSLIKNASRLGIGLTYSGRDGRAREKSLAQLGEEFAARAPRLADAIGTVREAGNRILHPKKRDLIAHPKVQRAEALDCIRAAQTIVETLQSDADKTATN